MRKEKQALLKRSKSQRSFRDIQAKKSAEASMNEARALEALKSKKSNTERGAQGKVKAMLRLPNRSKSRSPKVMLQ